MKEYVYAAFDISYSAIVNEMLYLPEQIRISTYFRITKVNFASHPQKMMTHNLENGIYFYLFTYSSYLCVTYKTVLG
jgi:hypothetical protein